MTQAPLVDIILLCSVTNLYGKVWSYMLIGSNWASCIRKRVKFQVQNSYPWYYESAISSPKSWAWSLSSMKPDHKSNLIGLQQWQVWNKLIYCCERMKNSWPKSTIPIETSLSQSFLWQRVRSLLVIIMKLLKIHEILQLLAWTIWNYFSFHQGRVSQQ